LLLQFTNNHLSISQFNSIDLPPFTVLTGVNGSGKSHLLEAIEQRKVVIAGMEQANIVRFNYETFKLENESQFNAHQITSEREAAWQFFENQFRNHAQNWKNNIATVYNELSNSCRKNNLPLWELSKSEPLKSYKQNIKNYFSQPQIKDNQQAQGIYSLLRQLPYSIDEINHDNFLKLYKPFTYRNDFLPYQLGKIIWDYYVKYRTNQVNEFENEKHGKHYEALSENEFITIHGEKPWVIINEILKKFDTLEYKINSPEGAYIFDNYHLRLMHTTKNGLEIDFSSLSSGERILMALVASVYKTSTDKHFPDILLLDEVDASLHPSMMKNMLDVIHSVFLNRNINVILVSHSPTTIALAPEDSIFVMNKSGVNRIEKKSKQEALAILTNGFATLDQGIRLFDEVSKKSISIISEGNNIKLLLKACELFKYSNVDVITDIEDISGKSQLKTLFDFFSRVTHKNKVLFVWDCDVNYSFTVTNNTFPFFLERNMKNSIATKGIENIFPEELFKDFKKTITLSNGDIKTQFDDTRKRDFEAYVLNRSNLADFEGFKPLFNYIDSINC